MDLSTVTAVVPADRSAIERWQPGDAWLAGGTWLFSEPQPELRRLIDLTAFAWPGLLASGDGLEIAATCTLAELAAWQAPSGQAPDRWPASRLIPQCCNALLGSFKVWNAATVGGNLCLALPAGPMTSLAAALDGAGQNALEDGALLRSVLLPDSALRSRTAFRQLSLSALGRSAVVVIGRRSLHDGDFVITLTASLPRPAQLRFQGSPSAEELREALDDAELRYYDDLHGDPAWREHLTRMYAEEVRRELEEDP
jgi:CO/xanthine dehydrogenase FAD-binding subunit